jgi:hypothetical protein
MLDCRYGLCIHWRALDPRGGAWHPRFARRRLQQGGEGGEAMSFRFWSHVDLRDDAECWLWKAYRNPLGYGRYRDESGSKVLAHRHAYVLARGSIPDGQRVLHDCDTPACVNPGHLHLGTIAQNNAERNQRGRQARGERNGRARLCAADVVVIRRRLSHGVSDETIAAEFGVHSKTIYQIARGLTWKHVSLLRPYNHERRERPVEERS